MPRCVGLQWAILNIVLQILGVWIALVQMSDNCENKGWWECLTGDAVGWEFNTDKIWRWEEESMHQIQDLFND